MAGLGLKLNNLYIVFLQTSIPVVSDRHFSSLTRRLDRIFADAYFHHREAFEQAEAESSLYACFLALTRRFELVLTEYMIIPTDGHNVVGDSLKPHLLDHLGMNFDDQTCSTEVITSSDNNKNELDMI